MKSKEDEIDPITFAVIRNGILAAGRKVFATIKRAGMHPLVYEAQDFGIALLDGNLDLLTTAGTSASHGGSLDYAARHMVDRLGPGRLRAGDVLFTNLPHIQGIHPQDFVLLEPVFVDDEVLAFVALRIHAGDIGGGGLITTKSTEVFQEGALLPPCKLRAGGEHNEVLIDIIRENSRIPDTTVGNTMAALGAVDVGVKAMAALVERYGKADFLHTVRAIFDHGERIAREVVGHIPDGVYTASGLLDDNGVDAGVPVRIQVTVTVRGERMIIDTAGSAEQQRAPINVPFPLTEAVLRATLEWFGKGPLPGNAGQNRAVEVVAPAGSIFNPGPLAASFWAGRVSRIASLLVLQAVGQAMPDELPAMHGPDAGSAHALLRDPRSGKLKFNLFVGGGGRGGRMGVDGASGVYAGETIRAVPLEVMETRDPALRVRLELDQDSGGPGQWRGGLAVEHEVEYLSGGLGYTSVFTSAGGLPTEGVGGGRRPKRPSGVLCYAGSDHEIGPPDCRNSNLPVEKGDRFISWTAGGGGYGNPLDRDVQAVAWDVKNEYVSLRSARDDYGVEFDDNGQVDMHATGRRRAAMRGSAADERGREKKTPTPNVEAAGAG